MFAPRFNASKMKLNLKLAVTRLQMLQKKNENLGHVARKEIAKLLEKGKDEMARIKTEQIIRDDYLIETMEIIEMYLTLLQTRFGLIESIKYCDPGLLESVATVIWCCPRLSHDIPELSQIRAGFSARYGKDFAEECLENRNETVNQRVIHKLSIHQPDPSLVNAYLQTIAEKYNVQWKPPQVDLLTSGVPSLPNPSDFPMPPMQPQHVETPENSYAQSMTYPTKPSYPPSQGGSGSYPPSQGGSYPPSQGGSFAPGQNGSYPPSQGGSFAPSNPTYPPDHKQDLAGSNSFPSVPGAGSNAYAPSASFPSVPGSSSGGISFPTPPGSNSNNTNGGGSAYLPPPSNPGFPAPPSATAPGYQPPSFSQATSGSDLPDLPNAPTNASVGTASTGSEVPDFDELTRRFNALKKNNH